MSEPITSIGSLIPHGEIPERDAIHIAVAPVVAMTLLVPGQHIGFIQEGDLRLVGTTSSKLIGIVDPFLKQVVQPNQSFWMFLYPQTITSLRHLWTHPAFKAEHKPSAGSSSESELWLRNFAQEAGVSYAVLMGGAEAFLDSGGDSYITTNYDTPTVVWNKRHEMWHHYEIVTGTKVEDHEATFFSCAC